MLSANDMVDLMGRKRVVCVKQAVLASAAGTLRDEQSGSRRNFIGHDRS